MTHLSVNVNKIATLRNARGKNIPDVCRVSHDILNYGADGITVHPRPDERHIKKSDVYNISQLIGEFNAERGDRGKGQKAEFNIEGYPSPEFLDMIDEVKPDQCTLVPDSPDVLTSNAGWDVHANKELLISAVGRLRKSGVRSSLFIDVFQINPEQIESLLEAKPDRVEMYTEAYAAAFGSEAQENLLQQYKNVALQLYDLGFGINAGHDLNLKNVATLIRNIPVIDEVSIGHALITEALYDGLRPVVETYLKRVKYKDEPLH